MILSRSPYSHHCNDRIWRRAWYYSCRIGGREGYFAMIPSKPEDEAELKRLDEMAKDACRRELEKNGLPIEEVEIVAL